MCLFVVFRNYFIKHVSIPFLQMTYSSAVFTFAFIHLAAAFIQSNLQLRNLWKNTLQSKDITCKSFSWMLIAHNALHTNLNNSARLGYTSYVTRNNSLRLKNISMRHTALTLVKHQWHRPLFLSITVSVWLGVTWLITGIWHIMGSVQSQNDTQIADCSHWLYISSSHLSRTSSDLPIWWDGLKHPASELQAGWHAHI